MLRQETFNLNLGIKAMQAGQDDAASARPTVLGVARAAAIAAAQAGNGTATADDAYRGLIAAGYKAQDLGNAAGARASLIRRSLQLVVSMLAFMFSAQQGRPRCWQHWQPGTAGLFHLAAYLL